MIDAGATVAIIEGNTILLTLREDFEVWCMPGGGLDEGESLAEAARREVREEIGLEVELTRLVGAYSRVGWRPHHVFMFAGRIVGGSLTPDPHEVLDARFFPFDALPDNLVLGLRSRVEDVMSGATGIVKTESFADFNNTLSRAEIYAMRDQSGLSRQDFYLKHIPVLRTENVITEVAGAPSQTRANSNQ